MKRSKCCKQPQGLSLLLKGQANLPTGDLSQRRATSLGEEFRSWDEHGRKVGGFIGVEKPVCTLLLCPSHDHPHLELTWFALVLHGHDINYSPHSKRRCLQEISSLQTHLCLGCELSAVLWGERQAQCPGDYYLLLLFLRQISSERNWFSWVELNRPILSYGSSISSWLVWSSTHLSRCEISFVPCTSRVDAVAPRPKHTVLSSRID